MISTAIQHTGRVCANENELIPRIYFCKMCWNSAIKISYGVTYLVHISQNKKKKKKEKRAETIKDALVFFVHAE